MKLLIANIFSIVCIIGAVLMAFYDKSGWGWLVFCGSLWFTPTQFKEMIHQIRTIGSRLKHRQAIQRNRRLGSERKMWEARLEMMKIESDARREALNRRIKAVKDHQEKLISRLPTAKH